MQTIKHKEIWSKFVTWFVKHKKMIIIIGVATLLILVGITSFFLLSKPVDKPVSVKKSEKPKPAVKYYANLTGKLVDSEAAAKQTVTGVMIENSPSARPQSGLKDSGVVFEAIAEGGITRFFVLYQSEKPQLIGPVRSLRLYDVEWLAAFDAGIAHVGGSAAALSEVRSGSYRDLDQFFNSSFYWRASDRYAPHNVYTSFEKLDALNSSKGYTSSNFTGFSRDTNSTAAETATATIIDITISSYLYNSSYTYDVATNTYSRYQGGEPHLDRESGQISPNVVIAMKVQNSTDLEDGYRENITTIGSGEAVIFQNGTAINATWHKPTRTDQITFTDANGEDIKLVAGQTWISAVPVDSGAVSWK